MEKEGLIEIFVPGRLCLLGEHSDWAGGHRRQNSDIGKGYAIVAPTNQGNYARVKKLDSPKFVFKSIIPAEHNKLETKLDESNLLEIAESGGLFSYIAGTALEVIASYHNPHKKGLEIENYKSDLPLKKGLSSSSSICVLVAKAFNEVYGLNLKPRRIMEIAYLGEITTPSRCGRLDQACAYKNPVLMTFDADKLKVDELSVGSDFYFLIVDLKRGKDTKKILTELNKGFPFPTNNLEKRKHDYLGPINKHIISRAVNTIKDGNPERLGKLMIEAQEKFDDYLAPACDELSAPKLHEILSYPHIQKHIYGGKGVGSQGDGSAQFLCRSKEDRKNAAKLLESKLDVECFNLTLKKKIY